MRDPIEHPSRETLQAFISGRIDDDAVQNELEAHIEACDECVAMIGRLSIDHQLLSIDQQPTRDLDPCTQESEPAKSLVGSWLGKYRVVDVIGQGGMGTVYQAEDTVLNRKVAIKTLLQPSVGAPNLLPQLIVEAQAAGAIAHPNVATVYDFVSITGVDCLVMEYLAGGSVADLLTHASAVGWEEAIRLISEACQGIDAAHRRGILHRDIKPANLLMTRDRRVKVGDFGLAMKSTRRVTRPTGTVAGTVHFMSPEQCRDDSLDPRSDIYSIGATLFTLLAGQPPYREFKSAEQISHAHCHAPIPNPKAIAVEIPSPCASIAMRAMAKKPDDRYSSCGELLDDLSTLTSESGDTKSSGRKWRRFAKLPTGPTVVVVPSVSISDDPDDELLANGIACEINSQLSQFRNLRVVSHRSAAQHATGALTNDELRRELSADYVVGGTIQKLGKRLRLTASLSATDTSTNIWSQRFDRTLTEDNLFEIQDEIAENVSSKLAQPYGEFHRAEYEKIESNHGELDAYQSVLRFYDYWHRELLDDYWPVRHSLESAIQRNPDYASAHAAMALMLVNAIRVHRLPDHDDALEQAVDHAQHALRLEPKSEMAHQALVTSLFHQGNLQQFTVAAEKALQAYPNHCELLADIGLFFVVSGNEHQGVPLAEKAIALSPDPPDWYFSALVCNAFLMGDFEQAIEFARRVGEDHVWGRVHHAVALANLGHIDPAAEHLAKARTHVPDFETHFDAMLNLFHPTAELRAVFARGLELAGLQRELPQ